MRIRNMIALAIGVEAAASAQQQAAGEPAFETVATAQRLEQVEVPPGQRVSGKRPITLQHMVEAGGAYLRLPVADEKAFRERHRLGDSQLLLAHLLRVSPEGALVHIGWIYCGAHVKYFSGRIASCFRNSDSDGRLDGAAVFNIDRRTSARIEFTPIDPAPYDSWTWDRVYRGSRRVNTPQLQIEYDFDQARNLLVFRARAFWVGFGATLVLKPEVEVDPASLPKTIEIGDARIRLLSWDGKKVTLAVERQAEGPILLEPPVGRVGPLLGSPKGYVLRVMNAPLPPQTFVRPLS